MSLQSNPDGTYTLRWMTGTKRIERTKYHIEETRIARWWWGHRVEYMMVSEFMTLDGFQTREEAHAAGRACGFKWRGGL